MISTCSRPYNGSYGGWDGSDVGSPIANERAHRTFRAGLAYQLGLPESYTPARLRVPTRMFPAEKAGEWEPVKIREKKQGKTTAATTSDGDGATGDCRWWYDAGA